MYHFCINQNCAAGPYNTPFTAKLVIENVSKHEKVAYRLMTLEPRHYIVNPSKGFIPMGQSVTVSITLQPIKHEASFRAAMQKFLVQVVPVQANSTVDSVADLVNKNNVLLQRIIHN